MLQSRFKTALVLSGGSARALAHLGVLEEMHRLGLKVDMVIGTSMGAIIGALYAHYGEVLPVIEKMRKLLGSDLFLKTVSIATEEVPQVAPDSFLNRFVWLFRRGIYYTQSMVRPTMVAEETYLEIMSSLIPDQRIEEQRMPFAAVAMDLLNGEEVVFTKGSLLKAVSASAAIPGILPPVSFNGRTLVDGGWVDNLPVSPAIALGAHFTIAVDAAVDVLGLGPLPTSAIESLFRSNEIARITLNQHRRSHADVMLTPRVGKMYWANFAAIEPSMAAGRAALLDNIEKIYERKRSREFLTLWGHLHPMRWREWRHHFVII